MEENVTYSWSSPRRRLLQAAIASFAILALAACGGSSSDESNKPANPNLILATTTSTQDSGLLDVLVPAFEESSGYTVKTIAVGTGQALTMGREGDADVLMVHAPSKEEAFVSEGFGTDRRLMAHNYFLVVGPKSDPAGVASATTAAEAFAKIAASASTFVSRGDGSGTETKEKAIWEQAGITPEGDWYIQSGQGMSATLQITSQKQGYTLTDDATFLSNSDVLELASLVEGDPFLLNIYHVMAVDPAKWPEVNAEGATEFEDFVTSAEGQELIGSFGTEKYGRPLFTADFGKDEAELS